MRYVNRFQRRLPPYTDIGTIKEISEISHPGSDKFKAVPFGLSTAPMELTAKEVKLIAIHKGIRIHQYLGDWLVRARSHQACLKHAQELVEICQKLSWLVNMEKLDLVPKQVFDFVCYQFGLKSGQV